MQSDNFMPRKPFAPSTSTRYALSLGRGILVLFLLASIAWAKDDHAQQLLDSASALVNISAENSKPFQVTADFHVQAAVPADGHVVWKWASKNQWSREITLLDYYQLEVRKGDNLYLTRNAPVTPLRVRDVLGLLGVFNSGHEQAGKVKRRNEGGVPLQCIETESNFSQSRPFKRTVCINPTNEVVSVASKYQGGDRRGEFSSYHAFRENHYPAHFRATQNGSTIVDIHNVSLSEATFRGADFIPPANAIVRRQCEGMTHPVAVSDPEPSFPNSIHRTPMTGTSMVAITVLTDGSVTNVQLLFSAGAEMDESARKTIQTWKFKPAMCGNEPVVSDAMVEVNFRSN